MPRKCSLEAKGSIAPYLRRSAAAGQGARHPVGPLYPLYFDMTSLLSAVRDHLGRARLLADPGIAIVAVSGGADSVALLDLLHALAPELGLGLVVAHADHGIQSDSRTVGQSVRGLAEQRGLPF